MPAEAVKVEAAAPPPPAATTGSKKTAIWLGGVVVLFVLAAAATWLYTRNKADDNRTIATAPPVETAPPIQEAAPVVETTPTPQPAPVVEPAPLPPLPTPATAPTVDNKPVNLSELEINRLVTRLQQGPVPSSCQNATQKIRKDANVPAKQATDIAKRAYPDLCNPKPIAPVPLPVAPRPEAKTIDQLYEERVAAECAKGITGLICREIINTKLCNGRWSETPPAGQKRCYRIESTYDN